MAYSEPHLCAAAGSCGSTKTHFVNNCDTTVKTLSSCNDYVCNVCSDYGLFYCSILGYGISKLIHDQINEWMN